jgi:NAD(P)H dehydrogenase (quinone)
MYAPGQPEDIPLIEDPAVLEKYDGFIMGIPTRFGNFPAQWRNFWDKTGSQWQRGAYYHKFAGLFVTAGTAGGGMEATGLAAMSTLAHHGIIYVPLGYGKTFSHLSNVSEVHGGSPWGAGSYTGADGSRRPTPAELEVATIQGEEFTKVVARYID